MVFLTLKSIVDWFSHHRCDKMHRKSTSWKWDCSNNATEFHCRKCGSNWSQQGAPWERSPMTFFPGI